MRNGDIQLIRRRETRKSPVKVPGDGLSFGLIKKLSVLCLSGREMQAEAIVTRKVNAPFSDRDNENSPEQANLMPYSPS